MKKLVKKLSKKGHSLLNVALASAYLALNEKEFDIRNIKQ